MVGHRQGSRRQRHRATRVGDAAPARRAGTTRRFVGCLTTPACPRSRPAPPGTGGRERSPIRDNPVGTR
jgi:hypothetical protein